MMTVFTGPTPKEVAIASLARIQSKLESVNFSEIEPGLLDGTVDQLAGPLLLKTANLVSGSEASKVNGGRMELHVRIDGDSRFFSYRPDPRRNLAHVTTDGQTLVFSYDLGQVKPEQLKSFYEVDLIALNANIERLVADCAAANDHIRDRIRAVLLERKKKNDAKNDLQSRTGFPQA